MDFFCRMCNFSKNPRHILTFRNAYYLMFLSLLSLFSSAGLTSFFPEEMMRLCKALAFDSGNVMIC